MDAHHHERLDREGIIGRRGTRQACLEATNLTHQLHVKVGKDADADDDDSLSDSRLI